MERMRLILAACLLAALAGGARADSRDDAHLTALQRGRSAMQDELYPLAEKHFREALLQASAGKTRLDTTLWLSRALLAQARTEEAAHMLEAARPEAAGRPEEGALLYGLARARFAQKAYGQALDALKETLPLQLDPETSADVTRLLARSYLADRQTEKAFAAFAAFDRLYPDSREAPDNLLDWAAALMGTPQPDQAAPVLDLLLTRFPAHPNAVQAVLWRAEISLNQNAYDAVEKTALPMATAKDRGPDAPAKAWILIARAREKAGRLDAAKAALAEAETLQPHPTVLSRIRLARAQQMIRQGDFEQGATLLREAAQGLPGDPDAAAAQLELADRWLERGQPEQAAEAYQRYLEAFTDVEGRVRALLGKGWCFETLKRPQEAAAEFEKAFETASDPSARQIALFKTGDAFFQSGQFQTALERYTRLVREWPEGPHAARAAFQTAECLRSLGQFDEAAARFADVENRKGDPGLAETAGLKRAMLHEDRGQWPEAAAAYGAWMERYPQGALRPRVLLERGLAWYRLGAFDKALLDFDALVRDFSQNPAAEQAFFMRGWCLYLQGEDEKALRVCTDFVAAYPASRWAPDVEFWLGEYAFNRREYAVAEKQFAGLTDRHPDSELADRALYWAGRAAAGAKEYLRAIEHFNRLSKAYPKSGKLPEARFAQGDALSELGEFAGAILAFDEIGENYPTSYLANLAMGRKGDCHYTLGAEEPARYEQALACYQAVMASPTVTPDLKLQAEYKLGRCMEKMNRLDEGLTHYMNVVYSHLQARAEGRMGSEVWFTRAAFNAAAIKEKQEAWREAVHIYRRVIEAGAAASEEAQARIRKIRLEKWLLF